jgi:hypothetical protein
MANRVPFGTCGVHGVGLTAPDNSTHRLEMRTEVSTILGCLSLHFAAPSAEPVTLVDIGRPLPTSAEVTMVGRGQPTSTQANRPCRRGAGMQCFGVT